MSILEILIGFSIGISLLIMKPKIENLINKLYSRANETEQNLFWIPELNIFVTLYLLIKNSIN